MRKLFIILILFLTLCSQVYAAPAVVSVNQTIDGESTVIVCTAAGVKSPAAPLIWDQFEWGSQGDDLDSGGPTTWTVNVAGEQEISTADKYAGTRSAHWQYLSGEPESFHHVYKQYTGENEIYFSYKFKYDSDGGAVFKFPRISADSYYTTDTKMVMTGGNVVTDILRLTYDYNDYDTSGGNLCGTESSSCDGLDKRTNANYDQWYGMQAYNKLSQPGGTANGEVTAFIDGVGMGDNWGGTGESLNIVNRDTGDTSQLEYILIGWTVTVPDATSNFYCDDVYVDNTKSKVILCDQSTYAASTHREMQPPTVWNANGQQISVTFNKGSFAVDATAYLVIMDADGLVSPGFEVTISAPSTDGQPVSIGTGEVISLTAGETATVY